MTVMTVRIPRQQGIVSRPSTVAPPAPRRIAAIWVDLLDVLWVAPLAVAVYVATIVVGSRIAGVL